MPFRTVAQSFPNDPNPPPVAPLVGGVMPIAPIALGHVHGHVALQAPPVLPRLRRISLQRVAQPAAIQPGHGLAPIALAPLDTATGVAPVGMVLGDHTTSFRPTDLPGGGFTEQFVWCPGEGASVEVRFEIIHANRVQTCVLELYDRGAGAPIWTQDFGNLGALVPRVVPAPLAHRSYYGVVFDCRVGNPLGTPGVVSAADPRFPGGWLTNDRGPYKLRMVITAAAGVAVEAEAWTYFHVPAHKFKLIRYVPSTEVGCIGLEYVPGVGDLKVVTNVYLGCGPDQQAPLVNMAGGVKTQLATDTRNRIYRDWSARFSLQIGGADLRPLVYVQPQAGVPPDVNNPQFGDPYAAYITGLTRAANRDFPIVFAKGNMGSGIVPSSAGHHLDFYLPMALVERYVGAGVQAETYFQDVSLVRRAMRDAVTRAPPSVTSITSPPQGMESEDRYTIVLSLARGAIDLEPAAANWLQNDLVAALNALVPDLSHPIPILLQARGKQGRAQNSRRTRQALARVRLVLANGLAAPAGGAPNTADEIARANAGYTLQPDAYAAGNEPRRVIHLDVDVRSLDPAHPINHPFPDHPYATLVHEFGHVFGLPDEYMDYSNPSMHCYVLWRSQPRLSQLCAQYGVDAPVFPKGSAGIKNSNLMTTGTVFHERYYLTFVEALSKLTCIGNNNAITFGAPPNRAIPPIPAINAVEDPAFAPLVTVLRNATDTFERGHLRGPPVAPPRLTTAQLLSDVLAEAQGAGHAELLYAAVLDSDGVCPPLATGRAGVHLFARAALLVADEILHCSIQAEPVRALVELEQDKTNIRGFVRDTAFFPAAGTPRVKLKLSASRPFAGTGTLTFNPGGVVQLYDAAAGGNLVGLPAVFQGTANPGELAHAAGVELWAEGLAEGTTDASLAISTGGMAPVAVATSDPVTVRVKRPAALFVDDQPAAAGVFLPLQGGLNSHLARTRVVVRRMVGNLGAVQIRLDKPAAVGPAGDYDLFALAAGGGALGLPHDLNNAAFGANGEVELWIAGTAGSPAVGDRSLTLAIAGGAVFTTVPVTVVTLHDLEITVPATAPLAPRNYALNGAPPRTTTVGVQNPNAAPAQVFKPHIAAHGYWRHGAPAPMAAPAAIADYGSDDFAVNHPLVLIEGSLPAGQTASVKAIVQPSAVPAAWTVERDDDDDERLDRMVAGRALPTLANAGAVVGLNLEQTAQLGLDHVGGFHLRLAVNGRDVLLTVNVVLVRARAIATSDQSRAGVPGGVAPVEPHINGVAAVGQHILLTMGTFAGAAINQASERRFSGLLRGRVHCIGGGPQGRLGQTAVFSGWVQNFLINNARGHYVDSAPANQARDVILTAATNAVDGANILNDPYFTSAVPARQALGAPLGFTDLLLDTGRQAVGGSTCLLGQSAADAPANDDDLGWVQKASAADAPNTQFFLRHPDRATALLTEMTYEQVFRAYLCVWTDSTVPALGAVNAGNQPTRGAGTRLFAALGQIEWGFSGQWTVAIQNGAWYGVGNGNVAIPANRVRVQAVHGRALTVQVTRPFATYAAAQPAEGLVEVAGPTILNAFAWHSVW